MAFKLGDLAVVLSKLNVVTVDHLPRAFPRDFVVVADQIDGFHEMTVPANKVCFSTPWPTLPYFRGLSPPPSEPWASAFMGSVGTWA
jgi:hypothetical protein